MKLHFGINDRFVEQFIETSFSLKSIEDHRFVIYGPVEIPFRHSQIFSNIIFTNRLSQDDNKLIELVNLSSSIYIHFLSYEVIEFLQKFDLSAKK